MSSEEMSHGQKVLIVGAGIFGASTALHLSRTRPELRITLLDKTPFPCPRAASYDINKIVRYAYSDLRYCRLAYKSYTAWCKEPLYKKQFHECGMLSILPHKGGATTILDNFKKLGIHSDAHTITPEETRQNFQGVFKHADFSEVQEFLWDPAAGWVAAAEALSATIQAAVDNGVEYVSSPVKKLLISNGSCSGAELEDGSCRKADRILLASGADTAQILADSAPYDINLHAGDRFVAAAISVAKIRLNPEQLSRYKHVPTVLWDADPARGETMPPTEDGYLKFIHDIPLANTLLHEASQTRISMPPRTKELTEWTKPENMPAVVRRELATTIAGIFGAEAAKELIPEEVRLCWDALAPDENWFITPHSKCENLFIATAGTGHAWKFLPVIGEQISQMMLEPEKWTENEMAELWAWDRELEDSPDEDIIPSRELCDMISSPGSPNL